MNNEYFKYNVCRKKEKKVVKNEIVRCYYCNSSRNFDLVNNRCNNCSKVIGYSKYTSWRYPRGINNHEIPAIKRRYKIEKVENDDRRLIEKEEKDDVGTCYCLIM
jgi:hypothetical protein